MWRMSVAVVIVFWACPILRSEDDKVDRVIQGDQPEHFEKHIRPLVAGIGKTKGVIVYEGLPHQVLERDALAKELKDQKTVKLHEFPFYEELVTIKEEDAKKLSALCSELKTFGLYRGAKFCGGFHPDWCLEFKDGDDVYRVLICFGCHEARLYGPKNEVFSDLDKEALKKLLALLGPLRKNRPKESDDLPPKKSTLDTYFERYCDYTGGLGIGFVASDTYDFRFRQHLKETKDPELKRLFVLQHLYRDVDSAMHDYERGEIRVGKNEYRKMTPAETEAAKERLVEMLDDLERFDPKDPEREIAENRSKLK